MKLLDYIQGSRRGKAARRMEIDAMRDPFLAEALEGYDSVRGNHVGAVAALQKRVSYRTKRHYATLWIVSACSAAAVALFAFYLLMQAPPYTVQTDSGELFVYIPENYVKQNLREYSPNVAIENFDILLPEAIDVYVPDGYVEKKQLTVYETEITATEVAPTTDILNLDEFFAPEEPIDIYLPGTYRQNERQNDVSRIDIIQID